MLDYDDFNSQHSLESIKLLFETVCEYVGYDADLSARVINSFDQSEVYVGGAKCGRLRGTLMSGHRGTTFINTILNEAYILCAYPRARNYYRLHVGDDVYIRTYEPYDGSRPVPWSGEWNQWKRGFKAMACLNGLAEAIEVAETVANGALDWPVTIKAERGENKLLSF